MSKTKLLAEWFWCDRWAGSSGGLLPLEARGLYREMLTESWRRGGRLPADERSLMLATRCTAEEWARCWPLVKPYWHEDADGYLVNDTQLEVYAEAKARSGLQAAKGAARAAQAGRQGGRFTSRPPAGNQPDHQPDHQPATSQSTSRSPAEAPAGHQPPSPSPSPSPSNGSNGLPPSLREGGSAHAESPLSTKGDTIDDTIDDLAPEPPRHRPKVPKARLGINGTARGDPVVARLCDVWSARWGAGSAPGGELAAARAMLAGHPPEVLVASLERYCRETSHPAPSPADWRKHFGDWAPGGQGRPLTAKERAEVDERRRRAGYR